MGKAVGFLIPFFIAAWFGVTTETDAFFFTYGIILFVSGIFAPVVETVIVPYVTEARTKNEDVGRFVGGVLSVSGVSILILLGIVLFFIRPILSVIARFDMQSLNLVYRLLIEMAPLIMLLIWASILAGTLNAYKKFAFPALSPAFRAIVNLSILFIFKEIFGVHAIALGYVLGEAFRLAILVSVIKRMNLLKLSLSLQLDPKLREFLKTASYQTIGMAAVGLNPVVDKTMASWLGPGSVSVLHYADRLYMIPVTFMTTGLMATLLSHWSGRYYESGRQRLSEDVKKAVKVVGFITLPIMLLLIFIHQPIVKIAFGHGVFDKTRLTAVGWVWVYYLFGFGPYVVSQIFNWRLIVLKQTRLMFILSLLWLSLNIVLNIALMHFLHVAGIALSTSLVYGIASVVLFSILKKDQRVK